jgi:hypothetical protein
LVSINFFGRYPTRNGYVINEQHETTNKKVDQKGGEITATKKLKKKNKERSRWDLNPESSPPEGDAVSISPRDHLEQLMRPKFNTYKLLKSKIKIKEGKYFGKTRKHTSSPFTCKVRGWRIHRELDN